MARSHRSRPSHPRLHALGRLLLVLPLAGALFAALLIPWVVGPGLAASSSTKLLAPLPVQLVDDTPPANTVVLASDGSVITYFYRNNRTPVSGDRIADVMKQAMVDIEDQRFWEHGAIDLEGTLRALVRNASAGSVQEGGSSITQQLVKQTLLQTAETPEERQAATEQSVGRKLKEARLALSLEREYPKEEILTRYLNTVYFGEGAYGVQAAARAYFSVDAADLTLPQAAMLAGLVQNPTTDDPIKDPQKGRARRDEVLDRMHSLGHISDQEFADVEAQPVQTSPEPPPPNGCAGSAVLGGFFCDFLQKYLTDTLGMTQEQLEDGGLTIQTTMRADIQRSGDSGVVATLPLGDPLAVMFTMVEPGTGHLLAMSVNRRFGYDPQDPAQESVNLNVAASQGAGSTYKVFTAAAALEKGIPPDHVITTSDPYVSRVYKNGTAPYTVQNATGNYPPTLSLAEALIRSSNTYFVALEDELGSVEGPVRTAQRMGLFSLDPIADEVIKENRASFTLGAEATSPLALASAYSTMAANGTQCDPTPVTGILGRDGKPLTKQDGTPYDTGDHCTPEAIPPAVATTLDQILLGDVDLPIGTGTRAAIPGHSVAGKTGTSQDRFSIAFIGFTPRYTGSVMVLNPKQNQDVGTYGGGFAAQAWHNAMAPIISAEPEVAFPPPGMPLPPLPPPLPPPA
ncbi:MAG TPA: transglycosylase domain-containing protein [Geodermatophilus sp.]|jgi:membrane peptidoglycan carboxypeptidase|nr:transglycosylase domain-containing protein [Geodermatophilus sp.]